MPVIAVVYDSEGVLPPTFATDEGFGDDVVMVRDLADAHRRGRKASVLVIVCGRDHSGAIGLLATFDESDARAVVLFLTDARHQRRVMLQGARRGAAVLIGQPPGVLAACLRELVTPTRIDTDGAALGRAAGPAMSAPQLCLLLVAARRNGRRRGRRAS